MSSVTTIRQKFTTNLSFEQHVRQHLSKQPFLEKDFNQIYLDLYYYNNLMVNRFHNLIIEQFQNTSEPLSAVMGRMFQRLWDNFLVFNSEISPPLSETEKLSARNICFTVCILEYPSYVFLEGNDWSDFADFVDIERLQNFTIPNVVYAAATYSEGERSSMIRGMKDSRNKIIDVFDELPEDPYNYRKDARDYTF